MHCTSRADFTDEINALANESFSSARSYKSCDVNDFRFHVNDVDDRRATQNREVALNADTLSFSSRKDGNPRLGAVVYFSHLMDIVELRYDRDLKFVIFKCDWVDPRHGVKTDDYKFTLVNFNNLMYKEDRISNEPFIIASQAGQVYFVEYPADPNRHVAVKMSRRGVFQIDYNDPTVEGY